MIFIDDWNTYHNEEGEIHCGTNVKRTPPGVKWWEQEP
ncbi:MAG: protein-arginine deiminase family protein [Spirochaetota bacterium]